MWRHGQGNNNEEETLETLIRTFTSSLRSMYLILTDLCSWSQNKDHIFTVTHGFVFAQQVQPIQDGSFQMFSVWMFGSDHTNTNSSLKKTLFAELTHDSRWTRSIRSILKLGMHDIAKQKDHGEKYFSFFPFRSLRAAFLWIQHKFS